MLCKCWNHHINNHHWQVMTHNLQHSDPDHLWMWTGSSDLWKHSHQNFEPSTCDRGRRRSRESLQAADESRNSSRRRGTNTQDHRLSLLTAAVGTLWITLKNINATRDAGCFFSVHTKGCLLSKVEHRFVRPPDRCGTDRRPQMSVALRLKVFCYLGSRQPDFWSPVVVLCFTFGEIDPMCKNLHESSHRGETSWLYI